VQYIGDAVKAWDAYQPSASVLLEDRHECRFSLSAGGSAPSALVYSYLTKQWSTTTIQGGFGTYAPRDALWWAAGGLYASCSLLDGVNKDTPGVYVDAPGAAAGRVITTTARTSWLHLGAMEGFQRVKWLYLTGASTSSASPTSTLGIGVDFDDVYDGTFLVTPNGSYIASVNLGTLTFTNPASRVVDVRHKLRRQKCKSVAFTFVDTPASAGAPSLNLQALALVVGVKRGTNKLPAAQGVP